MSKVTLPIESRKHAYKVGDAVREALSFRPIVWVTITPLKGGIAVNGPVLVDTGATMTAIDLRIAQTYGFVASGAATIVTANGEQSANPLYEVQLSGIAEYFQDLVITSCNVLEQGIMMLIGTDVLANSKLIYDGAAGEFSLEFPSVA